MKTFKNKEHINIEDNEETNPLIMMINIFHLIITFIDEDSIIKRIHRFFDTGHTQIYYMTTKKNILLFVYHPSSLCAYNII